MLLSDFILRALPLDTESWSYTRNMKASQDMSSRSFRALKPARAKTS